MWLYRKIRALLRLIKRDLKWKFDSIYCRCQLKRKKLKELPQGRYVVLMPHSDDEWIGCSQILIHRHEDVLVVNMDMPGGDDKELHKERKKEAERAAERYKYNFVTLSEERELASIIKSFDPVCVFLPCYIDWHEEHIHVMKLFKKTAMEINYRGLISMYQVSLPLPERLINCCMRMTKKQWREKWDTLPVLYKTQAFLPVKRFSLNEYINGGITGDFAIEAFSVNLFDEWSQNLDKCMLSEEDKSNVLMHLQDIGYVRKYFE